MSRWFHAMFDFNSFDFGERHFPYWPNQLYRIIDNKSATELKLLQIFALTSAMTPTTALASASLKIIWYGAPVSLSVHCCWHPYPVLRQNIRPRKGYERRNGRVRTAAINVSRAVQHAELFWMPYLLWLFGADAGPLSIKDESIH